VPNGMAILKLGPPNQGRASNAGIFKKSRFSTSILLYFRIHDRVVATVECEYIALHKIVFRVPKITRTARTLYEIKGVIWEYSYEGKHLEKR